MIPSTPPTMIVAEFEHLDSSYCDIIDWLLHMDAAEHSFVVHINFSDI